MENEGKGLMGLTDCTGAWRICACRAVTAPAGACVCFPGPGVRGVALACSSRGRNFDRRLVVEEA